MPADTDTAWKRYGKEDPYFGVLSDTKFMRANLDDAARNEFFESGGKHVESILATIRRTVAPDFAPSSALDFGCGVGRLAIPLARIVDRVVGVDISESMLEEARQNCEQSDVRVELVVSDDELSRVKGQFDLIHSTIVFQHIPVQRGMRILEALLHLLAPGGVGALQFTYASCEPKWRRRLREARSRSPRLHQALNRVRRNPINLPMMQMNTYD